MSITTNSSMTTVGAGSPPLGGDENRGSTVMAVAFSSIGIALLALGLRMYARVRIVGKVGWDDICIIAATALSCVGVGLNVPEVLDGVGRHKYYISAADTAQAIKWSTIAQCQNVLSTGLVKVSICIFLLRILTTTVMILAGIVSQCRPIEKIWDHTVRGDCWNPLILPQLSRAQGIISILTDLICSGFPVLILRNVKISRRTKVGLCGLMSLGLLASGCSIARIVLIESLAKDDMTWSTVDVLIWAVLEQNVGIFAACIPAIRPLFKTLFDRTKIGSRSRTTIPSKARHHPHELGSPSAFPVNDPSESRIPYHRSIRPTRWAQSHSPGVMGESFCLPMHNWRIMKTTDIELMRQDGTMTKFDRARDSIQSRAWSDVDFRERQQIQSQV